MAAVSGKVAGVSQSVSQACLPPQFSCPGFFAQPTPVEEADGEWWCQRCDREFPTQHQLCGHSGQCGHRSPYRALVDGSGRCPACGGIFHSRLRVLKHLAHSRCGRHLLSTAAVPLPPELVSELDLQDAAHIRLCRREWGLMLVRTTGHSVSRRRRWRSSSGVLICLWALSSVCFVFSSGSAWVSAVFGIARRPGPAGSAPLHA